MNACQKGREELIGCALGQPPGAALGAHLAACEECSQALEAWRDKASQMDAGIQQLTAATPRAHGPERILAQIRQLTPGRPFYGRVALAALVLTASLVVVLYRPAPPRKVETLPLMAWRSPTESLLHSTADTLLKSVPQFGKKVFETKSGENKNAP